VARETDVDMPQPDNVYVGYGNSIFVSVFPVPGQLGIMIQAHGTSGTLEIAGGGPSFGYASTFAINTFTPSLLANGSGWLIGSNVLTINGPAQFWLSQNTGATMQVNLLRLIKRNPT
jgi:hypothetical protein